MQSSAIRPEDAAGASRFREFTLKLLAIQILASRRSHEYHSFLCGLQLRWSVSSLHSSCSRCQQPLAVESASGMCLSCLKSLETSAPAGTPQSPASVVLPDSGAATVTEVPEFEVGTDTWDGQTRLRPSPAGYDLYRFLGGGGMGDVYLAREHVAERTVAMKFLRGSPNSSAADRFLTEIRALARLDHPNIVRFLNVNIDGAEPHYTMEYGSGGTLLERIKQEGPLGPEETARIAVSLAKALAAAHGSNILHRDLKPSNVVLAADNTPKITDFGLAKLTDTDEGLTLGSGPLGTPAYMPPEQISSKHGTIGPASDVYGLGATLYHLLTARPPFQGSSEEIIPKVEKESPPRIRSLRPDVPLGLEAIVHKCLEKRPEDRYRSATELASDLERYLAGEAPAAPQLTPARRAALWTKRNRGWFVGAAAGLALAIGLFIAGSRSVPRPENPPPSSPDFNELAKAELQAGRAVTLIPETGPPKWHRTHILPATLRPPDEGDRTCLFQSLDFSLIELLADPGIPRYRIQADVKHVTGQGPQSEKTPVGVESIGVYFGASYGKTPDDRDAVTLFNVYYNEFVPRMPAGQKPFDMTLRFSPGLIVGVGKKGELGAGSFWSPTPGPDLIFTPKGRPGPWRTIEIEVTENRVAVTFASPDEKPRLAAEWTGEKARTLYVQTQENLERVSPGAKVAPWAPERSLGLWCYRSAISVKNFTIEPLP